MYRFAVRLKVILLCVIFVQALTLAWNITNLEMRRSQLDIADEYIKTDQLDKALIHYNKAESLSKWFIRFPKARHD